MGRSGRIGAIAVVTVAALTKVAEFRDTETGEHLVRMRSYAQILGEELGRQGPYADEVDERFLDDLYRASPLHDIGKVGISDAILLKPGSLTDDEFETMKQHTTIGANILEHVAFGAPGVGGSIGFADPDAAVGYAYVTNKMGLQLPTDSREKALRNAMYQCLAEF